MKATDLSIWPDNSSTDHFSSPDQFTRRLPTAKPVWPSSGLPCTSA